MREWLSATWAVYTFKDYTTMPRWYEISIGVFIWLNTFGLVYCINNLISKI